MKNNVSGVFAVKTRKNMFILVLIYLISSDQSLMQDTKLNRPKISNDLLIRPHLIEKFEKSSHLPLILISAPAGYGKSMLLSQWLEKQENNYCWLSLDESMSDSTIF
ncbi:MAG: hypothetical protein V2I47_03265, partial [Bacteroidales bacterium]|nr:hypothetical protein [Bacteroidales bacterium]